MNTDSIKDETWQLIADTCKYLLDAVIAGVLLAITILPVMMPGCPAWLSFIITVVLFYVLIDRKMPLFLLDTTFKATSGESRAHSLLEIVLCYVGNAIGCIATTHVAKTAGIISIDHVSKMYLATYPQMEGNALVSYVFGAVAIGLCFGVITSWCGLFDKGRRYAILLGSIVGTFAVMQFGTMFNLTYTIYTSIVPPSTWVRGILGIFGPGAVMVFFNCIGAYCGLITNRLDIQEQE